MDNQPNSIHNTPTARRSHGHFLRPTTWQRKYDKCDLLAISEISDSNSRWLNRFTKDEIGFSGAVFNARSAKNMHFKTRARNEAQNPSGLPACPRSSRRLWRISVWVDQECSVSTSSPQTDLEIGRPLGFQRKKSAPKYLSNLKPKSVQLH